MKHASLLLLLSALAFGQPDAPSAVKTWKQSATSPGFLIGEGMMIGSTIFDVQETESGLHRCPSFVEENQYWGVGPRPTAGQLYRREFAIVGMISAINLGLSKHMPSWISLGSSGALSARHIKGGVDWMRCR